MSVLDARLTTSPSIGAPRDYRASYRESRQRGKMGLARWGEAGIDLEEIRTPVIFVRIKGSLLSLFVHVCARICVCVYILLEYIRAPPNVYAHFPDIRGETCYCVMISERFVASRCNPAGISTTTTNDRCLFNALNFFSPFFFLFSPFFPFKLSNESILLEIEDLRIILFYRHFRKCNNSTS